MYVCAPVYKHVKPEILLKILYKKERTWNFVFEKRKIISVMAKWSQKGRLFGRTLCFILVNQLLLIKHRRNHLEVANAPSFILSDGGFFFPDH